jgi:hypothetical protein
LELDTTVRRENKMGCPYCVLGYACQGENGMDDLEANCPCECHDLERDMDESDEWDVWDI